MSANRVDSYHKIVVKLVELMERDGLDRLHVQVGDLSVDLRMSAPQAAAAPVAPPPPAAVPATEPAVQAAANVRKVLAPLVGVFYRAPAPGAPPFVEAGQTIAQGDVLCVLEAMKLMNEIVSEHSGTIARVCVADGELVSLDQELFWIET
ncbi:MAG: acetyl-CoA carboxylase biotin carboxyl carrier protein [Candidatus Eremiobacteraeota bacterium]|nr:acetyl-CoA carboxylase biotin carboxyl carrier protein [Candidatus Eremiobacteraeota bacterium]